MANFQDVDGVVALQGGVATKISIADVTTPTAAELNSAFGAASANKGKIYISDDNNANTTVKLIVSNGTSWYFSASLAKAA